MTFVPNSTGTYCAATTDNCKTGLSLPTRGMVSGTAHELMETIIDPFGAGWYSGGGSEIADLCGALVCAQLSTGTFVVEKVSSNGAHACVGP